MFGANDVLLFFFVSMLIALKWNVRSLCLQAFSLRKVSFGMSNVDTLYGIYVIMVSDDDTMDWSWSTAKRFWVYAICWRMDRNMISKRYFHNILGGWVKRAPFTRIGRMDKPLLGFSFKKLSDFQRIFNPFSRNIMTERVHWCRKYSLQRSVTFSWMSYSTNVCPERNCTCYKSKWFAFVIFERQFIWVFFSLVIDWIWKCSE